MLLWDRSCVNSQYEMLIDGKKKVPINTAFMMHWASAWMPDQAMWTYAGINSGSLVTTWKEE